jgi:hypothetical protein
MLKKSFLYNINKKYEEIDKEIKFFIILNRAGKMQHLTIYIV